VRLRGWKFASLIPSLTAKSARAIGIAGSTHSGGNITGLRGCNAARVIVVDPGKRFWWNPPDAEQALAAFD
jgi:hypothetical protein